MKKTIAICLMLIAVMSMQAQSTVKLKDIPKVIIGQWTTTESNNGNPLDLIFDFKKQGSLDIKMVGHVNSPELGYIEFLVFLNAKYSIEDTEISYILNRNSFQMKFGKIKWNAAVKEQFRKNPGMEAEIKKAMMAEMMKEKETFINMCGEMKSMTIENMTRSSLTLSDDDGARIYTRK